LNDNAIIEHRYGTRLLYLEYTGGKS